MLLKKDVKEDGIERIKTHVSDLDAALAGGVPRNSIVLISGEAGTMKTTLCFHSLYNNVLEGKKVVYITLEETSNSILQQMTHMGYDLEKIRMQVIPSTSSMFTEVEHLTPDNTDFIMFDIGNIRHEISSLSKKATTSERDWLEIIEKVLIKLRKNNMLDIVVVDSLSALYTLSDFKNPRKNIFQAFDFFKKLGVTSLFISEVPPEDNTYSEYGVEDYLADGIIRMKTHKRDLKVVGLINVVKMRATPAKKDLYVYDYENNNFNLYKKLD
ncbi:hypothetical protein GOV04_04395 [Candidatus Woesearchaeota archaeon]|nr:hypothetical protein [Candidatus Woesearchaeota archaeon]